MDKTKVLKIQNKSLKAILRLLRRFIGVPGHHQRYTVTPLVPTRCINENDGRGARPLQTLELERSVRLCYGLDVQINATDSI